MFNCNDWKSVSRRKGSQRTDCIGRGNWLWLEARAFSVRFAFLRYQMLTYSHERTYLPLPCICPTNPWLATPGDSQFPQYHALPWLPTYCFLIWKNFPFSLPSASSSFFIITALRVPFWEMAPLDTWAYRVTCSVLSATVKPGTSWTFIVTSNKY